MPTFSGLGKVQQRPFNCLVSGYPEIDASFSSNEETSQRHGSEKSHEDPFGKTGSKDPSEKTGKKDPPRKTEKKSVVRLIIKLPAPSFRLRERRKKDLNLVFFFVIRGKDGPFHHCLEQLGETKKSWWTELTKVFLNSQKCLILKSVCQLGVLFS